MSTAPSQKKAHARRTPAPTGGARVAKPRRQRDAAKQRTKKNTNDDMNGVPVGGEADVPATFADGVYTQRFKESFTVCGPASVVMRDGSAFIGEGDTTTFSLSGLHTGSRIIALNAFRNAKGQAVVHVDTPVALTADGIGRNSSLNMDYGNAFSVSSDNSGCMFMSF